MRPLATIQGIPATILELPKPFESVDGFLSPSGRCRWVTKGEQEPVEFSQRTRSRAAAGADSGRQRKSSVQLSNFGPAVDRQGEEDRHR
jgi:hypothetical protein